MENKKNYFATYRENHFDVQLPDQHLATAENGELRFDNGLIVNFQEFVDAINDSFKHDGPNVTYYCNSKDKIMTKQELLNDFIERINKNAKKLIVGQKEAINPELKKFRLFSKLKKKITKVIFGRKMPLFNGQYVTGEELLEALNDYLKYTPTYEKLIVPMPPNYVKPSQEKETMDAMISLPPVEIKEMVEPTTYEVIKRRKVKVMPAFIATLILLLSSIGIGSKANIEKYNRFTMELSLKNGTEIIINREDVEKLIDSYKTGQIISVGKTEKNNIRTGTVYYESSDYKIVPGNSGIFGSKIRPEGKYTLEYISVLHNNHIVDVTYEKDVLVDEFIEKVSKERNIPIDELETKVHIGGPVSGWIDYNEFRKEFIEPETIFEMHEVPKYEAPKTYGNVITEEDNRIFISANNFIDISGVKLEKGMILTDSNGNEYRLNDYKFDSFTTNEDKLKFNFSLENIKNGDIIFATAVMALAYAMTGDKYEYEVKGGRKR